MRRVILMLLLAMLCIPTVEAKRRESEEEIAKKTRHYEGWEFGASARFGLVFYELDYMRINGQKPMRAFHKQTELGGNIMLNAGYLINNNWKVGIEAGAQIQYNHTVVPLYLTAHYFYGKRKNCLFNFVNMGTNILFDKGLRFGTTAAGGVGYRLQSPDSRRKWDIMVGYEALLLNPRPELKGDFSFDAKDVNRKEFNQMVFVGIGMTF